VRPDRSTNPAGLVAHGGFPGTAADRAFSTPSGTRGPLLLSPIPGLSLGLVGLLPRLASSGRGLKEQRAAACGSALLEYSVLEGETPCLVSGRRKSRSSLRIRPSAAVANARRKASGMFKSAGPGTRSGAARPNITTVTTMLTELAPRADASGPS